MRHKSKNKTRPLFTLSLEMTRLVNETRLLLVPGVNLDIYSILPQNVRFWVNNCFWVAIILGVNNIQISLVPSPVELYRITSNGLIMHATCVFHDLYQRQAFECYHSILNLLLSFSEEVFLVQFIVPK